MSDDYCHDYNVSVSSKHQHPPGVCTYFRPGYRNFNHLNCPGGQTYYLVSEYLVVNCCRTEVLLQLQIDLATTEVFQRKILFQNWWNASK